jgi:hypothetical protein
VGVIENCGKFSRLAEVRAQGSFYSSYDLLLIPPIYIIQAGCFCLSCPFEYVAGRVSLRVQELKVRLETKTLDNVFVTVDVSVQYQVSLTLGQFIIAWTALMFIRDCCILRGRLFARKFTRRSTSCPTKKRKCVLMSLTPSVPRCVR